jgi:hypothetical protein
MPKAQTFKLWTVTLQLLRAIYAKTGEKQVAIVHRLVCAEYVRLVGPLPEDA